MHAHGHPGLHFAYIVAITIQFVEDHRLGDVKQQATAQRLCRDITAIKNGITKSSVYWLSACFSPTTREAACSLKTGVCYFWERIQVTSFFASSGVTLFGGIGI